MSADNMICVQKIKNKWWVWMGFASDDKLKPRKNSVHFKTSKEAFAYARGWLRGEDIVEYGIHILPNQE